MPLVEYGTLPESFLLYMTLPGYTNRSSRAETWTIIDTTTIVD
jgi:hypothetical protein